MNTKNVYNALATFGQISIGIQSISCIVLAAALLVMGSVFVGSNYDLVPAVVNSVDSEEDIGEVKVTYTYKGTLLANTFTTVRATRYSIGDTIFVRVNPATPSSVSEDLPWKEIGTYMIGGAMALGFLSWYAIYIVSDNRNVAALAGSLSVLQVLV